MGIVDAELQAGKREGEWLIGGDGEARFTLHHGLWREFANEIGFELRRKLAARIVIAADANMLGGQNRVSYV